ncbi:MAG: UDP-N-acetylmuramate dehydrogenase [Candidatus Gracilibacteria bacterium]
MIIEEILIRDKDITELSNFKTAAIANYYFEINSRHDVDKVFDIYNFGTKNKLPILFIGGGTNMLFAFEKYEGIVIRNCLKGWTYDSNTKIIETCTGESISDISESLYNDYGQPLWKRFIGLPGSVGGAVFGNAGCFGLEIENNFLEAEVINLKTGEILYLNKQDMGFEYRNTIIKKTNNYFIINVKFDLSILVEKYSSDVDNIYFREVRQPKGNTCGSFFKNHSKENPAGGLIEKVGLKGKKIGGAYFSEKHANFLISDGATYKDLLELINLAQTKIKAEFDINLEPEVRIITN